GMYPACRSVSDSLSSLLRAPTRPTLFPYTTLFRSEVIDGVQLAALVVREVHAGDPEAQLEAQVLVVAQPLGDLPQVLPDDEEGQLAAVDDDLLDRRVGVDTLALEQLNEDVHDLVEPAAVGPLGGRGHRHGGDQAAEAGGVAGAVHP